MKRCFVTVWVAVFGCVLATAASTVPGAMAAKASAPGHVELAPSDVKWMPGPPALPEGVKIAVLSGNPFAEGFSIVRLKIPPHTTFAPHWHPTAESFTLLKGRLWLGMGDKIDKSRAGELPTMGFASIPAMHHHYVYTGDEAAVIDLSFYGPFQIHYVNPADDPRNK
ncbi:MAG: cupin domain-containing protein [Gammaproteobacteria bacterium]|nr:cupin domain-containing protein [Gammaproteobacteria bacterium]